MPSTVVLDRSLLVQLLRWLVNLERYCECWFTRAGWHCYLVSKWFDCTATLSPRFRDPVALRLDEAQFCNGAAETQRRSIDAQQTLQAVLRLPSDKRRVQWSFAAENHRLLLAGDPPVDLLYVELVQDRFSAAARPSVVLLELVTCVASLHKALKVEPEIDEELAAAGDYVAPESKFKFEPNRPDVELQYSRYPVPAQTPDSGRPQVKRQTTISSLFAKSAAAPRQPSRLVKLTLAEHPVAEGIFAPGETQPARPAEVRLGELRVVCDGLPADVDDLSLRYGHHTLHQLLRAGNLYDAVNLRWQRYDDTEDPLLVMTLLRRGCEVARCCVAQGDGVEDLVVVA